jgi:hypothetical protein
MVAPPEDWGWRWGRWLGGAEAGGVDAVDTANKSILSTLSTSST